MTIATKNSSFNLNVLLPATGVVLLSAIDSTLNSSSSPTMHQRIWNGVTLGATLLGAYHVFNSSPTEASSPETMITAASLVCLILNRSLAHHLSKNSLNADLEAHIRVFDETTENPKTFPLHSDGSLIAMPKKDFPDMKSLVLPTLQTYLLCRAANQGENVIAPLSLATARLAPCIISDFSRIWSENSKAEDVKFLSRKAFTMPENQNSALQGNLILGINLRMHPISEKQEDPCPICLEDNSSKPYSLCGDARHAVHYSCAIEYIFTRWQQTQIMGFNRSGNGWAPGLTVDTLPLCPCCQQTSSSMKTFTCRQENMQRIALPSAQAEP